MIDIPVGNSDKESSKAIKVLELATDKSDKVKATAVEVKSDNSDKGEKGVTKG